MENYSSTGAFIDHLMKALEETKPKSMMGWHFSVQIDHLDLVTYTLGSTATDMRKRAVPYLAHLLPADYNYTKRGVEYHWHQYQMDMYREGTLAEKPPILDCNAEV